MNPTTSCFLCRETHRKQHTTWTRFDLSRPPYWMFEQHQCCINIINKVHICSLALTNMKDLIHKKFTCLRDNMEIHCLRLNYVLGTFLPFSLPGIQNRKRHWNVTLPSVVWWIVSYYCACWCCWYPKVAPFKCMLSKSRGVLSVQKFEALPTGIRFDQIRTASLFKPWIIERKAQSFVFSSMIYKEV